MKWIPVSERLPELGTTVLVGSPYYTTVCTYHCDGSGWVTPQGHSQDSGKKFVQSITHWMPLPESPLLAEPEKTRREA